MRKECQIHERQLGRRKKRRKEGEREGGKKGGKEGRIKEGRERGNKRGRKKYYFKNHIPFKSVISFLVIRLKQTMKTRIYRYTHKYVYCSTVYYINQL